MKAGRILIFLLILSPLLMLDCRNEYGATSYFEKLDVVIKAGDPPDVAYVDSLRLPWYARNGNLVPLAEVNGVDKDFIPGTVECLSQNGQVYALPHDYQTLALMVNLDMLKQAGVSLPLKNWDDLQTASAKLTTGSRHGLGLIPSFETWLPFLLQAGGSVQDTGTGRLTLNTAEGRRALGYLAGLVQKGYATVGQGDWPYGGQDTLLKQFVNGQIGMMIAAPAHYADAIKAVNGKFKVGVAALPAGPARSATIAYVSGYAVLSQPGGKLNPSAAAFVAYATTSAEMRRWYDHPMYIPARKSALAEWMKRYPDAQAFVSDAQFTYFLPIRPGIPFNELAGFSKDAYGFLGQALVQANPLPPEQALQKVQDRSNAILDRYR